MAEYAQPDTARERRARLIAGGVIAIGVLAMLAMYLWTDVCDEQVTGTGNVVKVCRHLQATDPPVVALGAVLLVGLGGFFTEISILGFTAKRELHEIKLKQKETDEKLAETAEDAAEFHKKVLTQETAPLTTPQTQAAAPHPDIVDLVDRYNRLRWTMPSGAARTVQMTQVVRDLRDALRTVPDFDVEAHLHHTDRGVRLAAYAYLNDHDSPALFGALVGAAAAEDKPFGQYWGLLAVAHQLATGAARLDEDSRRTLTALRDRLAPGADRTQVLRGILG